MGRDNSKEERSMTPQELALRYMEIFFSGKEFDRLEDILHEDCKFRGPFNQFNSALDYIASLKADPPQNCSYKIIHTFEEDNVVNLVYYFSKPGVSTIMSQLFDVLDDKFTSMVLIFDSAAFTGKD
ncbi:MAG: nuclear transport factor 2 family protein [Gammaproteobacteria bacterium]